jgi:predicted transcriptional regulator
MVIFIVFMRVFQGFLGNKGTRYILQWEQGNKAKKIITRKGIDLVPRLSSIEERSGKSLDTRLQGNT